MSQLTIIVGPPASGKTEKAKEMCMGKKSVFINDTNRLFPLSKFAEDVVVIEDVLQHQILLIAHKFSAYVYASKSKQQLIITSQSLFPSYPGLDGVNVINLLSK